MTRLYLFANIHKKDAGGKVRGWLNGIEISRVSRKIYTRTHPMAVKSKERITDMSRRQRSDT